MKIFEFSYYSVVIFEFVFNFCQCTYAEGNNNTSSIFSEFKRHGRNYSPISQGRSSTYSEENTIVPSQVGFSSNIGYTLPAAQYYGRSPAVKIESVSHSQPIGMAVALPVTASPWYYDSYGRNHLYPYDNFDGYNYNNHYYSGKGGNVKTNTANAIISGISLLSCLALAIPLLLLPLALALGTFLSLALILSVPVPVVTVGGNTNNTGRGGNPKNPTVKNEERTIKDAYEEVMTKFN